MAEAYKSNHLEMDRVAAAERDKIATGAAAVIDSITTGTPSIWESKRIRNQKITALVSKIKVKRRKRMR